MQERTQSGFRASKQTEKRGVVRVVFFEWVGRLFKIIKDATDSGVGMESLRRIIGGETGTASRAL